MYAEKTIILVTGANSGIGYETVSALAATSSDYHIILACRSLEKGESAKNAITSTLGDSLEGSMSVVALDLTDHETITAAKTQVEKEFGRLDVLINNAGIIFYQQADTLTSLRTTFETNVFGTAVVTEAFVELLKRSNNPYLIYVSSGQGSISLRCDTTHKYYNVPGDHYRMSKSALNMLAACNRWTFSEFDCKVVAFCPGFCVTNLTGAEGREMRIKRGGRDAKDPANALVDVVQGKRDEDIKKSGIVSVDGGVIPW
ncbi:putative short chain dehydrogenase/reductase [Xylariaceae sp. FL1272]|nr:putative short chain dehydrogenase/reductase [Xylariaceae sp. FL1272]